MKKGGPKSPSGSVLAEAGFTIVETLIVLAVTGSMLIMAVLFVSGRQNKTEFMTSINNLQQQVQDVINQTVSGHYNNNGNFQCAVAGSLVVLSSGSSGQGTNSGCIFMGNVLQFGVGTGTNSKSRFRVIPIVGKQYSSGTQPVQTVDEAAPRAAYPTGTETMPTDAATTLQLQYGLTVAASAPGCPPAPPTAGVCYTSASTGSAVSAGSIGFIAGDSTGKLGGTGGLHSTGSQQFTLYGVKNTTPNQFTSIASQKIGNYAAVPTAAPQGLEPATDATACIASGTTSQSALIKVSDDLHVTMKIYGNLTCS